MPVPATSSSTSATATLLAFFDFPGLDLEPYEEVLGGLHHIAISVEPERWARLRDKLYAAGSGTRNRAARRCTSTTPMAPGSS